MQLEAVIVLVFVILAVVVGAFQVGLALGAPWGAAAYGGRVRGVLPTKLRASSAIAGFGVYPFLALFVTDASGLADTGLADGDLTVVWLWVVAALLALGTVLNLVSRSRIERVWAPVALMMSACCVALAALG